MSQSQCRRLLLETRSIRYLLVPYHLFTYSCYSLDFSPFIDLLALHLHHYHHNFAYLFFVTYIPQLVACFLPTANTIPGKLLTSLHQRRFHICLSSECPLCWSLCKDGYRGMRGIQGASGADSWDPRTMGTCCTGSWCKFWEAGWGGGDARND
jgi:hypothetical protein